MVMGNLSNFCNISVSLKICKNNKLRKNPPREQWLGFFALCGRVQQYKIEGAGKNLIMRFLRVMISHIK